MALPARRPKEQKRDSRWRSQKHRTFVKSFTCAMCGSTTNIAFAHYRLGSHAGVAGKPDDWRGTPLCDGPFANASGGTGCHDTQHTVGEATFWKGYQQQHGQTVWDLIDALCKASPVAHEIAALRREREAA